LAACRRNSSRLAAAAAAALLVPLAAAAGTTSQHAVSNGQILFGVVWPAHLQFGDADPKNIRVDVCGIDTNGTSRRWSITPPGMVTTHATIDPRKPRVAVTQVGSGTRVAFATPGHLVPQAVRTGGSASWSPDGTSIAFAAASPSAPNATRVFVLRVRDGSVRPLNTGPGNAVQPRWSPDGTQIAFVSDESGSNQIEVVAPDGTGLQKLTSAPGTSTDPGWSPDGTRLVFVSDRGGPTMLYTMSADGTGAARVGHGIRGTSPVWSPDGRQFAYATNEHLHVVSTSGAGDLLAYPGPIEWGPTDWSARRAATTSGPRCIAWGTARTDRLNGTRFGDVVESRAGNDRVATLGGDDQVFGDVGADTIDAGPGADWVDAGPGNDRITAGPGADHGLAGSGDDVVYARDGQHDAISCGPGRDTVYAERLDTVAADCENVRRR
jgi:hypothetical protein